MGEQVEDVPGEPRQSRHSIMIPRDTRVRASQTVSERPSDATESDGEQEFHEPRHSRASLMISEVLQIRASLAVESLGSDDLLPPDRDSPEQLLVLPRGSQARSRHSNRISVSSARSASGPKPMGVGLIRTDSELKDFRMSTIGTQHSSTRTLTSQATEPTD